MSDTRIYICTHKEFYPPEDPMYHPLQVGRAMHEDLGYEGDNTGDNISEKNETFCELTGLYWIWKNVKCDIVGTSHYRRYFCYQGDIIRKHRIEAILEDYDAIMAAMVVLNAPSVREEYEKEHLVKDLDIVRAVMKEKYPQYLDTFDRIMSGNLMSGCNMLITRKELFDDYCAWLFEILFEAERRSDISSYDDYQRRVFGFLGERLQLVYFQSGNLRIKPETIQMTNLQYFQAAEDAVREKKDVLKKMLHPLLSAYQQGNEVNLIDLNPRQLDFQGKLPVWVCWWQGEDQMPEIVKACYHSLQMNLPEDETEIHLITWGTLENYVDFPDFIMEKYRQKVITMTHLSDILRMALLTMYGGIWLDATYCLTGKPDKVFFKRKFYTQRFRELRYTDELVVKGRWSGNLIQCEAGNTLTKFVLNAFYYYWTVNTVMLDYFLIDYLILVAYEEISSVRQMITDCPPSEPEMLSMEELLNEAFEEKKWQRLTRDTSFFKLSYKHIFETETADGKPTFYAHIMNQYRNISND